MLAWCILFTAVYWVAGVFAALVHGDVYAEDDGDASLLIGVFWPVAIPVLIIRALYRRVIPRRARQVPRMRVVK